MDEEQLYRLIQHIQSKNRHPDEPASADYQDFLANFMHARNQGAESQDLTDLVNAYSGDRRQGMNDLQGQADYDAHSEGPVAESRDMLNRLLRQR